MKTISSLNMAKVRCFPILTSGLVIQNNGLATEFGITTHFSTASRRLVPWEEAVGRLYEVTKSDGLLQAKIGPVQIYLPIEMLSDLKGLLGKRITVLRTEKDYRLRVLKDQR